MNVQITIVNIVKTFGTSKRFFHIANSINKLTHMIIKNTERNI